MLVPSRRQTQAAQQCFRKHLKGVASGRFVKKLKRTILTKLTASAAGMRSSLTPENRPTVCQHGAQDFVEVPIVAKHYESMLQRARRDPHVISRNGTAAASQLSIHDRVLRRHLRIDDQLVRPLRCQKLLQFLAIRLFPCPYGKTAQQFAEHNAVHPNAVDMREHVHRLRHPSFEGDIGVGIEEDVPHCHNAGSTCSKLATACKKIAALRQQAQ
jgi:hypothetical protein